MHDRSDNPWAAEFEAVRRQRGRGRGHGRHPFGPGWGGPMGGPPPWVAQMFGPQWAGHGAGRGGRGRARARRGDVRSAILDVLAASSEPINGYQLIQQIAERSHGVWKPSPGSVYPTIAWLQDEGFVEDAPTGRKTLQLTDSGRQYVAEHADEIATMWRSFETEVPEDEADLRQVIGQTVGAIVQVASTGTPDQRDKAVEILAETRRRLYGLLAEGPDDTDTDSEE